MARSVRKVLVSTLWTVVVLAVIAGLAVGYMNRQTIQDHFAAAEFEPSTRVSQIEANLMLTPEGTRVFRASHPTVEGREQFNVVCGRNGHGDGGHVLGCFSDSVIHLFEINDERLTGIVEVTAAHELLHATFSRMDASEQERLSGRLTEAYEAMLVDRPDLKERMSVYEGLSAAGFANELHSVLGTEIRGLPDWLEEHYARWFAQRAVIVDFYESYSDVFASLKQQAEVLNAQLEELRHEIETKSDDYSAEVERFNADWKTYMSEWETFTARNQAYEFSDDPDEFYRLRDGFDARRALFEERRANLEATRSDIEAKIAQHEELRLQLLELGELSTELNQHIDSEFQPLADEV